uniref:POT-type proton-dependent oligopeptide transporter n=1 Tax=Legionella yabuuchiae TaxID=376727 RepID=UPI0010552151
TTFCSDLLLFIFHLCFRFYSLSRVSVILGQDHFYVVLNLGALASPLIFGFLFLNFIKFSYCFYLSSLGLFVVSFIIGFRRKLILSFMNEGNSSDCKGYFMILITFLLTLFIIKQYNAFHNFIFILVMLFFYMFYSIYKKQPDLGRRNLIALLGLLVFCMIFFAASLQVGSALTFYLDRYVDKSIYGINIPTSVFASLNPFFLILTAPIFQFLWKKLSNKNIRPNIVSKLSYGIITGGLGFLFFLVSSFICNEKTQFVCLFFIILGYICIGAGEICLSPPILHALNLHAPKGLKNTVMGAWYLFMAFSSYLGGLVDILFEGKNVLSVSDNYPSILVYQETFLFWGALCIVAGIILLVFNRKVVIFDVLVDKNTMNTNAGLLIL